MPGLQETFSANLSKMIFLEITIVSKEDLLGICLLGASIFNLRQFDFADVVSNLLKPKVLRVTFFINDRLPSENVFECSVKDGRYLVLPVVVIDFDSVIALETLKSVEQKEDQVTTHSCEHSRIAFEFVSLVAERHVCDGAFVGKCCKTRQKAIPQVGVHAPVGFIAMHKGIHVQGDIGKPARSKRVFVAINNLSN